MGNRRRKKGRGRPRSVSQPPTGSATLTTSGHLQVTLFYPLAWLTVGISSVPRRGQNNLLHTLVSLFHAASEAEQKHLTVLVHLADSDLTRLQETIVRISRLFSSQILAGQLILIGAPPDASRTVDAVTDSACGGESYFKQNIDHAFLMSFATNLSNYFLLLDDNVFCAPNFVTHILWKVNNMRSDPWVPLEFSTMGFLGKLFHSRNLQGLAHFLIIFHKETPLDMPIPHFCILLAQRNPVLCRPFFFYRRLSYTCSGGQKAVPAQRTNPCGPDNPLGAVFMHMKVFDVHFPWEAYTLDESFFWTHYVRAGNHLTVTLDHPAAPSRVPVLAGTTVDGKYALEKGQVERAASPRGCLGIVAASPCRAISWKGRWVREQWDSQ